MKTNYVPWAEAAFHQLQSYQRTAFFLLGCLEREHMLNLQALRAHWFGASKQSTNPPEQQPNPTSATLPPPPLTATATTLPKRRPRPALDAGVRSLARRRLASTPETFATLR